jgi:hypothetical protein
MEALAEHYGCHLVRSDRLSEDDVVSDLVRWAQRALA